MGCPLIDCGVDIAERLHIHGLLTSEGTLYPLLARLRRNGQVQSSWRESNQGAARRYYTLTPEGKDALHAFTGVWNVFNKSVNQIINPAREDSDEALNR
ncbi:PadR family transcriptional regulator [Arthrobacter antibioticus]|uniref:PadR family transcriptional regulator n=1 Tax=Arthrobacter sp. H35-MC1 TaxID=3046203 RepID=UPI0024B9799A|nr:PadR family transcriptional regulator [Arthrobacter sp. H35-MC1]MDJ0317048.1 PadR family transcriptional regulator [Arthrobacter sp. H35-MC1]